MRRLRYVLSSGLLLFFHFCAVAQTVNFHGEVTDTQGEPLAFVSVWINDIGKGTATNQTGFFQISLKPGEYTFTIRKLGYQPFTGKFKISKDKSAGTFRLKMTKGTGEFNADTIIAHVIANKSAYHHSVPAYAGQLYSKNLQQLDGAPKAFFRKDVARKLNVSPDRRAIISLSESVSEYHTRSTDYIKERLISAKMTNDSNAYGFNSAAELHIDLYKDYTVLRGLSDHAFFSPIALDARRFYRYTYAGSFVDNGALIYTINVKPRHGNNEHLYKGTIYIVDKQWLLYGADLYLNHQNRIDFADSITIKQQFAKVDSNNWLPQNTVFRFYGRLFGFKYSGYFLQLFQTINRDTTSDFGSGKEVFNSNRNNYKNNDQVLENERPLPLLPPEEDFYTMSELNQRHKVDQTLTDSIQNTHGKFKIIDYIFNGYTLHDYKHNAIWTFPSPQFMWFYNTVEGFGLNGYVRYKKVYNGTQHSLTVLPDVRYGFSDKVLNANVFADYVYNPFHQGSFYGRIGTDFLDLNERGTVNPFINSLNTLFLGNNFIKLYQSRFIMAGTHSEVANGVLLNGQFEYAQRSPLYNTTLHTFNSDSVKLTSNNPLDPNGNHALFPQYNALIFRGSVTFTFDQQYKITPAGKFIMPNPYPRIRLNYHQGIPILGSDVNYSNVSMDVFQDRLGVGLWGYTAYYLSTGRFLSTKSLYYPDYFQFLGGESFFFNATLGTFHFLNYYTYSTDKPYFEAHIEHNFTGCLLSHVPLLNQLHLEEIAGGSFLTQGTLPDYKEFYVGVKRTVFRLDYGWAFGRFTQKVQGLRFFYNF